MSGIKPPTQRCKARTKAGPPCKNFAIKGTNYCYVRTHGPDDKPTHRRILNWVWNHAGLSILAMVGLLIAVTAVGIQIHDERINATAGVLDATYPASTVDFSIGSSRIRVDSPDGVVISDGNTPLLTVLIHRYRKYWFLPWRKKLLVSAIIRDPSARIVAQLRDNEWSENVPRDDRNYTNNAVEVEDQDNNVILQVVDFGYTVAIAGVLRCSDGWSIAIAPDKDPKDGGTIETRPPWLALHTKVPPICEYPSSLHLGACPGIQTLKASIGPANITNLIHTGPSLPCK